MQNSQLSSPLVDHSTNSLNSGIITTLSCTFIITVTYYTGGYVFIRGDQIIGGAKIFLTLDYITLSVINEIFVYQLNGSVLMMLRTSSQTLWSSTTNLGVHTEVGGWRQVSLYSGSLFTSNTPTNLEFVAIGSSGDGFAAVDDLIIQVQSNCNYDALSDPG